MLIQLLRQEVYRQSDAHMKKHISHSDLTNSPLKNVGWKPLLAWVSLENH